MNEIVFNAAVFKVQTLVDHGIRVTFDLPESATMQMAQLAECQRFGVYLEVSCLAEDKLNKQKTYGKPELEARTKRKSEWTTEKETGIDAGS